MDAHMAAELRKRGGSADGFRARRLTSALAHEADLLMVMSQEHRIFILDEWPDLVRRTWLLGQAARSASQPGVGAPDSAVSGSTSSDGSGSGGTDAGAAASVNVVSALRAYPAPPLSSDSIPDPYQRGAAAAARAAARIENALHQVLGA